MDGRALTSANNARKKAGTKSAKTLLKEQVRRELEQRMYHMSHKLLNAQAIAAVGTHKMIQIMNGPNDTKITRTIRHITEIERLLDTGVYGKDYIIIEGREGDWKAANAILDRALGKAKETIDLNATVENITTEDKEKADKAVWNYLSGKSKDPIKVELNKNG